MSNQDFQLIESILWAQHPFWPDTVNLCSSKSLCTDDYIFSEEKISGAVKSNIRKASVHARFFLLERHRARLEHSAKELDFPFSPRLFYDAIERLNDGFSECPPDISGKTSGTAPQNLLFKIRLLLFRDGRIEAEHSPITPLGPGPARFDMSSCMAEKATPIPLHKTTLREGFNREFAQATGRGLFDTVFINRKGEVTEGAITNIFVEREPGSRLLTPRLDSGLLPGTLRGELIDRGIAEEAIIPPAMLEECSRIYLGNSVRGLVPTKLTRH